MLQRSALYVCEAGMASKIMQINEIIQLMGRDDSVDAPENAIAWSKNIFRTRVAAPEKTLVQRIFATLQIDLAPGKAAFGERSASALKARQLLFSAGDAAVDLRVSDFAGRLDVHGQILGDGFEYSTIRLFDGTHSLETVSDEMGEFHLRSASAGTYSLTISAAGKEIVVENIELA